MPVGAFFCRWLAFGLPPRVVSQKLRSRSKGTLTVSYAIVLLSAFMLMRIQRRATGYRGEIAEIREDLQGTQGVWDPPL